MTSEPRTDRQLSDMVQSLLNHGHAGYAYVKIDDHLSALFELQSLRSAREAEPVAWRSRDADDPVWNLTPFEPIGGPAIRQALYLHPSPSTEPGPDSETYYTKGKDGPYWEDLPDADFARELSYACQDLNDTGLGNDLDKWMPFQIMMGNAADRISSLLASRSPSTEGLGVRELQELFGTWLAAHGTPEQIDSYNSFHAREIAPVLSALSTSAEQVEISKEMVEKDRSRLIHILVVHFDMLRNKAAEVADLFLYDKTLTAALSPIPDNQEG